MRLLEVDAGTSGRDRAFSGIADRLAMLPEIEIKILPLMFSIKVDHAQRYVSIEYIRFYR